MLANIITLSTGLMAAANQEYYRFAYLAQQLVFGQGPRSAPNPEAADRHHV